MIPILYPAFAILILSFLIGLLLALNPYLFIPTQIIKKLSLWGDPTKQPALIIFTIKSKGTLTANYPIDVEVEIRKSRDVERFFHQAKKMELIIPDSYEYPIKQSESGMFPAGKIPISLQDGKGKGKIIFPNAGSFSVYHILVDDNPVFTANFPKPTEAPIFVVEDYGIRLQIQNSRNLGVAVMSLSLTAIGFLLGLAV
jgi:hypothetical protein